MRAYMHSDAENFRGRALYLADHAGNIGSNASVAKHFLFQTVI